MLGDKRLIRTIRPRSFLSFGPTSDEVGLLGLNVLIGPNGSGKSNLIEAIDLLRACPKDLQAPIRTGGGVAEWLWKGSPLAEPAEISVTVDNPAGRMALRHSLSFTMVGQRFELADEAVENEHPSSRDAHDVYFYYRYQHGHPAVNVPIADAQEIGIADPTRDAAEPPRKRRSLRREDIAPDQSVLSQRKDPDVYPEITYLGNEYAKIRLYREWDTGRQTTPRQPQKTDLPENFLTEDASNLGLVLNDLEARSGLRSALIERLHEFHEPITDIYTRIHGGTVQLFLHERGLNQPIPATRLSDGTLRFLCLLAILCHPSPPPLICIEEPEIGLHPDILPTIARLLVEASQRTQLIVTTHSDALVDALTETPEAVMVCEKHEGSTTLRRLDKAALKEWLEKYTLGQLWRKGELGGNRW
jgi:predicted ATPase